MLNEQRISESAFMEWLFHDYLQDVGFANEPTAFDGRSDYGQFIENGIPAGGLFTGAEGIRTEEQAGIYSGTAGEAYDPCYDAQCDTIDNVNLQRLGEMSDPATFSERFNFKHSPITATRGIRYRSHKHALGRSNDPESQAPDGTS